MPKTAPPVRPKNVPHNKTRRPGGEHLTEEQVELLRKAAAAEGRHGHRDATMILLAYTHALRVGELVSIEWSQINLENGTIYIQREKGSISGEHFLRGIEVRALKKLGPDRTGVVFRRERKDKPAPMSADGFRKIVQRAGENAGLGDAIHPHMLRHAYGYKAVNQPNPDLRGIQTWMGHSNIQNTVAYTKLKTATLKGMWDD